jgi:selenocysteine-specific elongation factor
LLSAVETGDRRQILSALLAPGQVLTRAELLARTGWSDQDLEAVADQAVVIEGVFVHPQRFADLQAAIFAEVQRFHAANPLTPGIAREELRGRVLRGPQAVVFEGALSGLVAEGKLETAGEMVRQAGRQVILTGEEAAAREQILAAFEKAGLLVPPLPEVLGKLPVEPARARKILQLLLKEGALIRVTEDLLFHRGALQQLRRLLTEYKSRSNRLNVGTFKDLTGVTRKYAIPLLEYLDRERVTRRVGDERVLL